MEINSNQNFKK